MKMSKAQEAHLLKRANRGYDTDINTKHIEKVCPARVAGVHIKGRHSKSTYIT